MKGNAMQVISFREYGAANVLESAESTRPVPASDEVLVRVVAAGVNPADANMRAGMFGAMLTLPFVPGFDMAGTAEAVGDKVTRVESGDSVYAMLPLFRGGGYAQYAVVKEQDLALKPARLTFAEAAAVPLAALTALQALRNFARVTEGQRVFINGASGGVGTFAVQIARIMGANVTATTSALNIDLVRSLGANDVIDYTQADVTQSGQRFDVVFDAVGIRPLTDWQRLLTPAGTGVTVNPGFASPAQDTQATSQKLVGMLVQPNGDDLATLARWIEDGLLRPVLDRVYPLDQAAEAHRHIESKRARGKIVLMVGETAEPDKPLTASASSSLAATRRD